jgi:hypothetical protein
VVVRPRAPAIMSPPAIVVNVRTNRAQRVAGTAHGMDDPTFNLSSRCGDEVRTTRGRLVTMRTRPTTGRSGTPSPPASITTRCGRNSGSDRSADRQDVARSTACWSWPRACATASDRNSSLLATSTPATSPTRPPAHPPALLRRRRKYPQPPAYALSNLRPSLCLWPRPEGSRRRSLAARLVGCDAAGRRTGACVTRGCVMHRKAALTARCGSGDSRTKQVGVRGASHGQGCARLRPDHVGDVVGSHRGEQRHCALGRERHGVPVRVAERLVG